jgi:hypothetical protein
VDVLWIVTLKAGEGKDICEGIADIFPLNHGEPGAPYPTLSKEEKKRNFLFCS